MEQELRLKVSTSPEDARPLRCPVDGCGDSSGRLERIEVFRDDPDSEESVSIRFQCSRGHIWWIAIHDRGGELAYTLGGLTPTPPIEEASSRGY